MASGLVCRAYRPNTWLHRPACKCEEKPCQLGAVHTWHKADMPIVSVYVRFRGQSGHSPARTRCLLMMLWTAPTLRHRSAIDWFASKPERFKEVRPGNDDGV